MTYVIVHGRGLSGLGAAAVTSVAVPGVDPNADARTQVIQGGILVLVRANQRAKQLADAVLANPAVGLTTRGAVREWRQTFTMQVEAMVSRAMTPGRDGVYPFERSPQVLTAIADFVESEGRQMGVDVDQFLGLASGLRQAAAAATSLLAEGATTVGGAAGKAIGAAVNAAANNFPPGKSGAITGGLVLLGVAAVSAYVWRSFR